MALYISTEDGVVDYRTVHLYWGRPSRVWCCISLLGTGGMVCRCRSLLATYWWSSSLKMFTGESVIGNVAVDLH